MILEQIQSPQQILSFFSFTLFFFLFSFLFLTFLLSKYKQRKMKCLNGWNARAIVFFLLTNRFYNISIIGFIDIKLTNAINIVIHATSSIYRSFAVIDGFSNTPPHAKIQQNLETSIEKIKIFNNDVGIVFSIKKCAMQKRTARDRQN